MRRLLILASSFTGSLPTDIEYCIFTDILIAVRR